MADCAEEPLSKPCIVGCQTLRSNVEAENLEEYFRTHIPAIPWRSQLSTGRPFFWANRKTRSRPCICCLRICGSLKMTLWWKSSLAMNLTFTLLFILSSSLNYGGASGLPQMKIN